MDTNQAIQLLEQAIDGLMYESESDEPFEVVHWSGDGNPISAEKLLELSSNYPDTPVKVISPDEFFKRLTTEQDWYEEAEISRMLKYRSLKNVIEQCLSGVRVFRVGEVRIAVYIIGVAGKDDWVGVKTLAVET